MDDFDKIVQGMENIGDEVEREHSIENIRMIKKTAEDGVEAFVKLIIAEAGDRHLLEALVRSQSVIRDVTTWLLGLLGDDITGYSSYDVDVLLRIADKDYDG